MWQVRTLVNSVEVGSQFYPTAGTVLNLSDDDYEGVSARSWGTVSTVSASTSVGATTVTTAATTTVGTVVNLDTGNLFESATVTAVSGSGPYSLTVAPLTYAHASGVAAVFGGTLALVAQVADTSDAVSTQAAYVAAAGALTSVQGAALTVTGSAGTTYTTAEQGMINALKADITTLRTEYNALQVDVAALRTKLNAELTALQVASGPQASS